MKINLQNTSKYIYINYSSNFDGILNCNTYYYNILLPTSINIMNELYKILVSTNFIFTQCFKVYISHKCADV